MDFDRHHVNSRRAAVAGVVDPVATYSEASLIGVVLLWAIVDVYTSICDVFDLVNGDLVPSYENYGVSSFADSRYSLS
jgi:hypothetical protein